MFKRRKKKEAPGGQALFFVLFAFILLVFGILTLNVAYELGGIAILLFLLFFYSNSYDVYKDEKEFHGVNW